MQLNDSEKRDIIKHFGKDKVLLERYRFDDNREIKLNFINK